jgi:hypothetical protein
MLYKQIIILYNILKGFNVSLIIYLDIDYYGLENVMIELSLPKKFVRHAVGVRLSFSWDSFGIERMIVDKIINSNFVGAW